MCNLIFFCLNHVTSVNIEGAALIKIFGLLLVRCHLSVIMYSQWPYLIGEGC